SSVVTPVALAATSTSPRIAARACIRPLPSKSQSGTAADDILVRAVANSGVELHVIVEPHRGIERHPVCALEITPVHGDRETLVRHQARHARHREGHGHAGSGLV